MSIEALAIARKVVGISPRDKSVLLGLADYASDEGIAWPKQQTLADWTCYALSTVGVALASLEELGLIASTQRYRDDGGYRSKAYALQFARMHTYANPPDAPPLREPDTPPPGAGGEGVREPGSNNNQKERSIEQTLVGKADAASEEKRQNAKREGWQIEEVVALWNEGCGELAKTRVVSPEIEKWIRKLLKRRGFERLVELATVALPVVREDPHWLGKKAPEKIRSREGAAYGLINFLRHLEDKANVGLEEVENEPTFEREIRTPSQWYTDIGVVKLDYISGDRKLGHGTLLIPKNGDPAGTVVAVKRSQIKGQRYV